MQTMMTLFFWFLCLCLCMLPSCSVSSVAPRMNFGVGLTSIPPRFSSVHHVVRSWLLQEYSPSVVVIFIPKKYVMFGNGIGNRKDKNIIALESELRNHFATEMDQGRVVIQVVSKDVGPLTKYVGMMEYFSSFDGAVEGIIDQWVIGDDDVHYASGTLSAYVNELQKTLIAPTVMTHFNVHARLEVHLDDDELHPVPHFQGVDTILFPRVLLQSHADLPNGVFRLSSVLAIADHMHKTCPESFFQDDYVISAVIFAAQIPFRSVWSGTKVALHVDDVSTSFQQMHLSVDVFDREQATKQCVVDQMPRVLHIMRAAAATARR